MKKELVCMFAMVLFLAGCRAHYPVAQQSGKEDVAYLLFIGQHQYGNKDVEVSIDDAIPFTAKTVKPHKANRKGIQYAIGTGNRNLKVTCDGKTLYKKKIFVSSQEVKQVILP